MSLQKTILVWIVAACIVWIALNWLPMLIRLNTGRATGFGIVIPTFLRGLPTYLQVTLSLLGVPLLIGSLGGFIWYFIRHP